MTTCCCCFDEDFTEFVSCNDNHIICKGCVNRGVENAIGDLKYFKCPDGSMCDNIISHNQIATMIDNDLMKSYSNMTAHISIKDIPNLQECKFCDYAVIIEIPQTNFYCVNCDKLYCYTCKNNEHPNEPCNKEIYSEAERLSKSFIITCTCSVQLIRGDACNHLTCRCGKLWCWWCKQACGPNWHPQCPLNGDPIIQAATTSSKNIADRIARDPHERALREQLERDAFELAERQRLERERLARIERARIEAERIERERLARIELARIEAERIERERLARIELARIEAERIERARLAEIERARIERELLVKLELERLERLRIENERIELKRAHQDKMDKIQDTILELENERQTIIHPILYNKKLIRGAEIEQADFFAACVDGNLKIIKQCLKTQLNPNYVFFEAVLFNRIDVVTLLLSDSRVMANIDRNKAIKQAIRSDYAEMVKLLLSDVNVANSIDLLKLMKHAQVNEVMLPFYYLYEKYTALKI